MTSITLVSLMGTCVAIGCIAPSEKTDAQSEAIANNPPPNDPPPPRCVPNCTGKACGAADGCGHTCTRGICPAGTVCGGGGTMNVCACAPSCAGKACGASDGCGGICTGGSCATGYSCGAGGAVGQCAPIPLGQSVECFVFDDGYASMAGPSDAIVFSSTGQACVPGGSTGICRKWLGRCRTTDSSHTPVTFQVAYAGAQSWSVTSDAIYSYHYSPGIFSSDQSSVCVPNGTNVGDCRDSFGNGSMAGMRPVHCRLFDDGYANMTALTNRMADIPNSQVWGQGLNGQTRKWFGRCQVGGCGDGVCLLGRRRDRQSHDALRGVRGRQRLRGDGDRARELAERGRVVRDGAGRHGGAERDAVGAHVPHRFEQRVQRHHAALVLGLQRCAMRGGPRLHGGWGVPVT